MRPDQSWPEAAGSKRHSYWTGARAWQKPARAGVAESAPTFRVHCHRAVSVTPQNRHIRWTIRTVSSALAPARHHGRAAGVRIMGSWSGVLVTKQSAERGSDSPSRSSKRRHGLGVKRRGYHLTQRGAWLGPNVRAPSRTLLPGRRQPAIGALVPTHAISVLRAATACRAASPDRKQQPARDREQESIGRPSARAPAETRAAGGRANRSGESPHEVLATLFDRTQDQSNQNLSAGQGRPAGR